MVALRDLSPHLVLIITLLYALRGVSLQCESLVSRRKLQSVFVALIQFQSFCILFLIPWLNTVVSPYRFHARALLEDLSGSALILIFFFPFLLYFFWDFSISSNRKIFGPLFNVDTGVRFAFRHLSWPSLQSPFIRTNLKDSGRPQAGVPNFWVCAISGNRIFDWPFYVVQEV
jgi:hypothetical protein